MSDDEEIVDGVEYPDDEPELWLEKSTRNRTGKPRPSLDNGGGAHALYRDPDEIMRLLGFKPGKDLNPLQFLLAVANDDLGKIYKNPSKRRTMQAKGGIAISLRASCAKTAARFIHLEMPKISFETSSKDDFAGALAGEIEKGKERVKMRRVIIEQVEQESPDAPLAAASYPPAFEFHTPRNAETLEMTRKKLLYGEDYTDE